MVTEVSLLWREHCHVTELDSSKREWSCSESGHFNGGRMVMLQITLMEGELSCYRGKVTTILMEGEWSCCGGGQFYAGRMVLLQRWSV